MSAPSVHTCGALRGPCAGCKREGEIRGLLRAARYASRDGLIFGNYRWVSEQWLRAEAKRLRGRR